MQDIARGLAGVVVDTTAIADVQAEGILTYRGRSIAELVEWSFPEVVSLLLGETVNVALTDLNANETRQVISLDRRLHPMRVLQGMLVLLDLPPQDDLAQGVLLGSKLPAILATHQLGAPVEFSRGEYARTFLSGFKQMPPAAIDDEHVAAFNMTQILQLEHSFNAGTFAARVVASTLADIPAALAAGLGALSGGLHGGADQAALELVDGLHSEREIRHHIDRVLAAGARLPGMGHREYRVRDPRAAFLEDWADRLAVGTPHALTFEKLKYLEDQFAQAMQARGKQIYTNLEFYKGLVYRVLGFPNEYFTAAFALARVYGYVAHFLESRADNRIYRPQARYVGA